MPPVPVEIVHPLPEHPLVRDGVNREFIGRLVRTFYARVMKDGRLGPIFAHHVTGDWEPHLERMTDFWCSVVLKDGSYQGRPVPAHLKLKTVVESDFEVWLGLFGKTVWELCEPDVAEIFVERAQRIAKSLKLAMFFRLPPHGGMHAPAGDAQCG
jgi:hemoglobin